MHTIRLCYTWLSCILVISFSTHSCGKEVVHGSQHKSAFREADSLKVVTNNDILSSSTSSSIRISQLPTSLPDRKNLSASNVDSLEKMNLIIPPTSNTATLVSTYRIKDPEVETTCILMTVDALLTFTYPSKINQMEEKDVFVPDSKKLKSLSGDCSEGEKSWLKLKWDTFELKFYFTKTPGGEKWFVSSVQLSFTTEFLIHSKHPNTRIQAQTAEGDFFFPTPVGRSFQCKRDLEINLTDPQYEDINVKVTLRQLTVEPFIFKDDGFGPEYLCSASGVGTFRSETAPFIFGCLLMLASLFTVAGYAIYRYLRVNKVQYDTME